MREYRASLDLNAQLTYVLTMQIGMKVSKLHTYDFIEESSPFDAHKLSRLTKYRGIIRNIKFRKNRL